LLFEYLPGTASGWSGIEKLEPGTILTFADGRISRERYWQPRLDRRAMDHGAEDEAAERLSDLLRRSVRQALIADVPVGVFLSGGVDSSLVTALAAEAAPDLTAFTVRVRGRGSTAALTRCPTPSRSRATSGCGTRSSSSMRPISSRPSMRSASGLPSRLPIPRCCPPGSSAARRGG